MLAMKSQLKLEKIIASVYKLSDKSQDPKGQYTTLSELGEYYIVSSEVPIEIRNKVYGILTPMLPSGEVLII